MKEAQKESRSGKIEKEAVSEEKEQNDQWFPVHFTVLCNPATPQSAALIIITESQYHQQWNIIGFTKAVLTAEFSSALLYMTQVLLFTMATCCKCWQWTCSIRVLLPPSVLRLKRWAIVQASEWVSVTWLDHSVPVCCWLMLRAFYFQSLALVGDYFTFRFLLI